MVRTGDPSFYESITQPQTILSPLPGIQKTMRRWHWFLLAAVLLLSLFLNFYRLWDIGYGNSYYAAGVKSMLISWHTFFFVSFDPGGFVTIDKPPLGFWLQTASAWLFGFNGFSLFLPEALAGVLSVALLFHLVRRVSGPIAGLLAALMLAITPLSIVTSRNNTIDSLLVLTVLLGAWAVSLATEQGRLRWLVLCAFLIGLGFNIKMLEAYLVVPAFGLLYLLGAPIHWWKRLLHLCVVGMVVLIISLSWVVTVDLIPASQRPYVGSSGVNSELNLAIGYNGLQRLLGHNNSTKPPGNPHTTHTPIASTYALFNPAVKAVTTLPSDTIAEEHISSPDLDTMKFSGSGTPGPLRFFSSQLASQISWLLPLALFGLLALGWQARVRFPLNRKQQALLLWGIWLITMLVFFSRAAFFNIYYLVMLAPALSALAGSGLVVMWQDYTRPGWRGWLLPFALLVTAATQAFILSDFPTWSGLLIPLIVIICLVVATILIIGRFFLYPDVTASSNKHNLRQRLYSGALMIALLALFIAPTTWGALPVLLSKVSQPLAGPMAIKTTAQTPGPSRLVNYLQSHQGTTQFLVAALNAGTVAPYILATGKPAMALGGFSGSDRILTANQLAGLVSKRTVRFFLFSYIPSKAQHVTQTKGKSKHKTIGKSSQSKEVSETIVSNASNSDLTNWVSQHCAVVPSKTYGGSGSLRLFDCSSYK